MKSKSLILIVITGLVSLGIVKLVGQRSKAADDAARDAYTKDFRAGKAKPLDGPFVEPGILDELQFKVVALPKVTVVQRAFNGDLLCLDKSGPSQPKKWKIIDRDGHVKENITGETTFMTRTGQFWVEKVGSPKVDKRELYTNEGFFVTTGRTGKLEYIDPKLASIELDLNGKSAFVAVAENETLGTIGNMFAGQAGNTACLGFLKGGKLTEEAISIPHVRFVIVSSRQGIAVTAGRAHEESIPYWRKGPNEYVRLAAPKGAIGALVTSVSQNGDYILQVQTPPGSGSNPYSVDSVLVTKGKYYNLQHIHQVLFGTSDAKQGQINSAFIDDFGDLIAEAENGSFLIQPLAKANP